jgi:organic radical activating enzyme
VKQPAQRVGCPRRCRRCDELYTAAPHALTASQID